MSGELAGKTALVTGGASGIGAASAVALAAAGATVAVADLKYPATTVDMIAGLGGIPIGMVCDVASEPSVKGAFALIGRAFGGLDIAVHAAGILIESRIVDMPVEEFDRITAVNLRGTFLVAQLAARSMIKSGGGRIIAVSSELAYLGRADFSAYCATKSGVLGLVRSLARELAPNILVNSVAPGPVDTPMLDIKNMSPAWREKESDIPLGRVGEPDEIASVIRFLAGPGASFITGQTISPNGGAAML